MKILSSGIEFAAVRSVQFHVQPRRQVLSNARRGIAVIKYTLALLW